MICQRCLLQIRASYPAASRGSSVISARANASILSTPRRRPPTISVNPSTVHSFSNSSTSPDPSPSGTSSSEPTIISSVSAGTPLKGLGYLKGKDPPLAKDDNEYPKWLWGLLNEGEAAGKNEGGAEQGDSYSKSKKSRRLAARAAKAAKSNPEARIPKVPIEHQSIDLPVGDGTIKGAVAAAHSREEVTIAMRKGRRKSIKEGNFLKAMR